MISSEGSGALHFPTVIQDLLDIEFHDRFTFHAKPRTRHAGLLFQNTLRGAANQRSRQNPRLACFQTIDDPDRLTREVERDATDVLV